MYHNPAFISTILQYNYVTFADAVMRCNVINTKSILSAYAPAIYNKVILMLMGNRKYYNTMKLIIKYFSI